MSTQHLKTPCGALLQNQNHVNISRIEKITGPNAGGRERGTGVSELGVGGRGIHGTLPSGTTVSCASTSRVYLAGLDRGALVG